MFTAVQIRCLRVNCNVYSLTRAYIALTTDIDWTTEKAGVWSPAFLMNSHDRLAAALPLQNFYERLAEAGGGFGDADAGFFHGGDLGFGSAFAA